MDFQSVGAVAIVKVNAHWFHVRERGGFSGIFGTMIASGIFFAFTVNGWILEALQGTGPGRAASTKWVFYAPAFALGLMFVVELFLLKDRPGQAGHADFDTGDASSGDMGSEVPLAAVLKKVVANPIILTVASIEFCTGVLRQGVMHWFRIFAKEQVDGKVGGELQTPASALGGWEFMLANWGLLLFAAGVIGANAAGWTSDKLFQSRRGPSAAFLYAILLATSVAMIFLLPYAWPLAALAFLGQVAVIGTHGLLSGTATMDFGGRKGAATAVGMIDGFVYLGTGLQSLALGSLTERGWQYWPIFLAPFALVGLLLCLKIWHALPGAARRGGH
jgi:OPA family glycerol-3-phosphate transporter-like MFS transporter